MMAILSFSIKHWLKKFTQQTELFAFVLDVD